MTSRKQLLLLYGPILWLRKVLVYLIIPGVILGLVLYFVANSPLVIKKFANAFAPDYNITYSRIHGNVLSGVEIDDLAYDNASLAKHITLKWNPAGLFMKKIIVKTLKIEKANVDTIKALITSFESNESSSSEPFDFGIGVEHALIDIEPFVEQRIGISNIALKLKDMQYESDSVSVDTLGLEIDSNVTDIRLHASLKEGRVIVKELTLKDVDTLALETIFLSDSNESDIVASTEDNSTKTEPINPLIPKWVVIEKLETNILPRVYETVELNHLLLTVNNALFDVQNLVLQKGNLELKGSTNLSDISYITKAKENHLIGQVQLRPTKELFELYALPVRKEAIGDIVIDVNASEERVVANMSKTMKQLLKGEKDDFNLDIDSLKSRVVYEINDGVMKADTKVMLSTPYAKDVLVTNLFTMDENISYSGEIHAKQIIGVEPKFVKPLNNLQLKYQGDTQSINTEIESDNLQGTLTSSDFKKADLHLESREAIVLNELIELPPELNQTKVNVVIDIPIHFDTNTSLVAYAKISSNVLNVDANISYEDILQVKSVSTIPEESLLRSYSKELKWDSLNPIRIDANLIDDSIDAILTAGTLAAKASYALESKKVDGKLTLAGLHADISGIADQNLSIHTKINSMQSLIESLKSIYTFADVPVVNGSADISVEVSELKRVDIVFKSPKIIYHADRKTAHPLTDMDFEINMDDSKMVLEHYRVTYDTHKFFSTKPSTVSFSDDTVSLTPLWINDQLEIVGEYNIKTKQGTIDTQAKNLHTVHEMIDLDSNIDIKTVLDANSTSVNGEVVLLDGMVHYDTSRRTFASDSDILIVQDMKEKKERPFMDTLSASIHIKTENPLVYKEGNIDTKANVDLLAYKAEYGEFQLVGTVELLEGGHYIYEGKKFVLDKSHIYFTGNPNEPLIDGSVKYRSANYYITITATGSMATPKLDFSSKPSLTKEQILSVILFDSQAGAKANSGDDMMKMMGGAMARSALSDMGIAFDHLVLGEGNSLEVGKKLTEKILVILNTITAQVKLKYLHTEHVESVVGFGAESQSYDIIYTKDY